MKQLAHHIGWAAIGLVGALSLPALANDSTGWVSTGGVQYLKNQDIRMVSEDLYISLDKIRVQYEFANDSAQAVHETILFPLPAMRLGVDGDFADIDRLHNSFKIWVNGRSIAPQKNLRILWDKKDITDAVRRECRLSDVEIIEPFSNERGEDFLDNRVEPCLKTLAQRGAIHYPNNPSDDQPRLWDAQMVYSWQQTFPAKQSIRVQHEYTPLVGGSVYLPRTPDEGSREFKRDYCIDANFVRKLGNRPATYSALGYILTTGANWAKPIERFHLTVEKPADALLSMCWDASLKEVSDTRFEAFKTNFTPKTNLEILFAHPYQN